MNSQVYRMVAYYTRATEEQAKNIIRMAKEVAYMGDLLCQFEFNGQQISVRVYPTDHNAIRIGLVDKRINIIVRDDNQLPIVELF